MNPIAQIIYYIGGILPNGFKFFENILYKEFSSEYAMITWILLSLNALFLILFYKLVPASKSSKRYYFLVLLLVFIFNFLLTPYLIDSIVISIWDTDKISSPPPTTFGLLSLFSLPLSIILLAINLIVYTPIFQFILKGNAKRTPFSFIKNLNLI
jgi:hypothetical protein